jgi:hypothetical protein
MDLNIICDLLNYYDDEILKVISLYVEDYSIFLTGRILKKSCFNIKQKLLSYFDKYNISYFEFTDKNKIMNMIHYINSFIKNASSEKKEELTNLVYSNEVEQIKFEDSKYKNNTRKKIKQIYFFENIIEPNILYKKNKFSNQELFIPFNNYVIKKMEYKLRTFCQIAEKLGAEKIVVEYSSSEKMESSINLNIDSGPINIGSENNVNNIDNNKIQIIFEYPHLESSINLNKFEIIESIFDENEFLITKEEFNADIELKFLIDARCIHFIKKYNTNFMMNHMNKIEHKVLLKAENYGLNIGNLNLKDNHIKFSIHINFCSLENNYHLIDGTNIYILREGFYYLSNIIKNNNMNYQRLLFFLKSHLNGIQKKWIEFEDKKYITRNNINKIYNDIIIRNFKEDEIIQVIEYFFKDNLNWDNFIKFRNILLYGSDKELDKLYFISFQYHDTYNNKKNMLDDIYTLIKIKVNQFIEELKKSDTIFKDDEEIDNYIKVRRSSINLETESGESTPHNVLGPIELSKSIDSDEEDINVVNFIDKSEVIYNFLFSNIDQIIEIIFLSFKRSFKIINGLSNNIENSYELSSIIKYILNYYFNNNIKSIQLNLNEIIIDNNESYKIYDIKKYIFENLAEKISYDIIYKKILYLSNISPIINYINIDKPQTLYERNKKIFIRFLIRFYENENKLIEMKNALKIDDINDINSIMDFIEYKIPINKVFKNYNQYKLFYIWDDFIEIKKYL